MEQAVDDVHTCGYCNRTTSEPLNRYGVHDYCMCDNEDDEEESTKKKSRQPIMTTDQVLDRCCEWNRVQETAATVSSQAPSVSHKRNLKVKSER